MGWVKTVDQHKGPSSNGPGVPHEMEPGAHLTGIRIHLPRRDNNPPVLNLDAHALMGIPFTVIAMKIPGRYEHLASMAIHTGCASANIACLNFTGSALGVTTSTGTPSKFSSSCLIAPMSNKVASGDGSIRISKSLASVSAPCATEPKTRALRARLA